MKAMERQILDLAEAMQAEVPGGTWGQYVIAASCLMKAEIEFMKGSSALVPAGLFQQPSTGE